LSTKINATVDALGNPTGFTLTPGQACDLDGADILLPQIEADIGIADKGFDADERVIEPLEKVGKGTVIPPKANRKHQREYDKELYKRVTSSRISSPNSSSSAPSPPAKTSGQSISSRESTSPQLLSGSIEDKP
jgi:transposase